MIRAAGQYVQMKLKEEKGDGLNDALNVSVDTFSYNE